MPHYWVMRNNKEESEFFWKELKAGRLTQVWSSHSNGHLPFIDKRLVKGKEISEWQCMTWKRNRRMLESQSEAIRAGDVVISPHLPEIGVWSISRVTGRYCFNIPAEKGDYGHWLPVEHLTSEHLTSRPVNPHEEAVSAPLRQTMRKRSPLWNIDHLGSDVERLLKAVHEGKPDTSIKLDQRLQSTLAHIEGSGWESLSRNFQGAEFESPCVELLNKIFGDKNVEHVGDVKDRGGDVICTYKDPIGFEHRVAVQITMCWDADSTLPLDQIRHAAGSYEGITSAIIIATSEKSSKEFEEARRQLEKELHIPINMIYRSRLLRLFFANSDMLSS